MGHAFFASYLHLVLLQRLEEFLGKETGVMRGRELGGQVFLAYIKRDGILLLDLRRALYLIRDVSMSNYDLNLAFPVILYQPGVVLSVLMRLLLDFEDHLLLRLVNGDRGKLLRRLPRNREGGVGHEVVEPRVLGSPLLRGVGDRRLEDFSESLRCLGNALLERELQGVIIRHETTWNPRETHILDDALPGISVNL